MHRKASLAATAVVLPLVLAAAAGCASSSAAKPAAATSASASPTAPSNVGLSGANLIAAMNQAEGTATALLVQGTQNVGTDSLSLHLQLNKDSASGTMSTGSAQIPIRVVGGTAYFQFTTGVMTLIKQDPSSATGKLLLNKWVSSKSPLASGMASSFSLFMSLSAFMSRMNSEFGTLTARDGVTTLNGMTVAQYSESSGGILYIPASGPALPIQETSTGTNSGTITFTWNQPTTVTAPPASEIYSGS